MDLSIARLKSLLINIPLPKHNQRLAETSPWCYIA